MGSAFGWRFLVDENLNPAIVAELEARGIEATWVPDALGFGADDLEEILPYCRESGSILVTNNVLDFNPAALEPTDHPGIVIVHDTDMSPQQIAEALERLTLGYGDRHALTGFESADDWVG